MTHRDKRALIGLGVSVVLFALLQIDVSLPGLRSASTGAAPIEAVEQSLKLARARAGRGPLVQAEAKAARVALDEIEEGLLSSENTALALAEMRQILENLLRVEDIAMKSAKFSAVKREGDYYTAVPVDVNFTCRIEQFVNWIAAVGNAPQLLSTRRMSINSTNSDTKTVTVNVTVAGFLPVSRTPELTKSEITPGGLL